MIYSIVTQGEIVLFRTLAFGRVVWLDLAGSCQNCGCQIHNGRRNAESDKALRQRLGGKRTRLEDGVLRCAGCGHGYHAKAEPTIAEPD